MISISERQQLINEVYYAIKDQVMSSLRVSGPGIIQSFDAKKQTATVQMTIKERLIVDGQYEWVTIPLLLDCPVKMQRGGGYAVSHPFKKGDECLVVFGDRDMGAWWQNGGIQQYQFGRKHDLSDGYVLPGITSQKTPVSDYSTNSMQIRSEDGTIMVELAATWAKVTAKNSIMQLNNDGTGSVACPSGLTLSQNTTINGDLQVNGNIKATGTITPG